MYSLEWISGHLSAVTGLFYQKTTGIVFLWILIEPRRGESMGTYKASRPRKGVCRHSVVAKAKEGILNGRFLRKKILRVAIPRMFREIKRVKVA